MNKIGTAFISGAIGLAIGAIGSYIFFKKKYESMYYNALEKAIDEECDRLRKRHGKTVELEEKEMIFENNDHTISPTPSSEQTPYHTMISKVQNNTPEEIDPDRPHFIDEDEYRFLPPEYDFRELQLLRKDGTVLDENDEIVDEPDIYISGLEKEIEKMSHLEHCYILIESVRIAVDLVTLDDSYDSLFGGEI